MNINTKLHMSDEANTIIINKNGTIFEDDAKITNFQDIINKFNIFSKNGNDKASTKIYGLVKLIGDEDDDVLTTRTFIDKSISKKATTEEMGVVLFVGDINNNNTSTENVITPKDYKQYFDDRKLSDSIKGIAKYATKTEVDSRKGNSLITPNDLVYALDTMIPKDAPATETETGLVKIINITDLYGNGKGYDDGYTISPKTFQEAKADQNRFGIGEYASVWTGSKGKLLSPKSLLTFKGEYSDLLKRKTGLDPLLLDNEKIFISDTERIAKEIIERRKKELIDNIMGVGDITITSNTTETIMLKTMNGQSLDKNNHMELFNIIGYRYGGSGNNFNLPDARGMIMKMYGKGGLVNGPLGNIKSYNIGDYIPQGVAKHKHAGFGYRSYSQSRIGSLGKRKYVYIIKEDNLRGSSGAWGFGRTKNGSYHGSRTRATKNCVLRYGDYGSQHGVSNSGNDDTRPWNMSLNFMIRVI